MRRGLILAAFIAVPCAASCLVRSFDIDPATSNPGGSTSGGAASGGEAALGAGVAGMASGGMASGGMGGETVPGEAGAGGEQNSGGRGGAGPGGAGPGGAGGAGGAGGGAIGPVRIGFSVFHDSAAGADQASSSLADATFAKPTGTAAGDFILVFFGADHSLQNLTGTKLAAAGWKLHDQRADYGTDGQATYLIYKIAGAAEPDPIVFAGINPVNAGNGVQGLLSVYRGVSSALPINAYDKVVVTTGSKTTPHIDSPTPSITTTVDHCLLLAGLSPDTAVDAPTISSWPQGFSENRVSVTNPPTPYPNGWANIYLAERRLPTAGVVPASSFGWDMTYGGTEYYGVLSFVIALAP